MRSKVAEELRLEQIEEMRRMTPSERIALARELRERGLIVYMAAQKVDRDTALKAIRRERQAGRRYSRCMDESLK
jgi:hypothetical protein